MSATTEQRVENQSGGNKTPKEPLAPSRQGERWAALATARLLFRLSAVKWNTVEFLLAEGIRLGLDPAGAERLERLCQEQEPGLGVHARPVMDPLALRLGRRLGTERLDRSFEGLDSLVRAHLQARDALLEA
jgi:hypothetical protein